MYIKQEVMWALYMLSGHSNIAIVVSPETFIPQFKFFHIVSYIETQIDKNDAN